MSTAESPLEVYERLAEDFHRETGMLAPGKDSPAAAGNSPTYEERAEKWNEWCAKRRAALKKQLDEGCAAKIMPLRERRLRACGKPGELRPDGRVLCPRHERIRKQREQLATGGDR